MTACAVGGWLAYHAAGHAGTWLVSHAALVLLGMVIGLPVLELGRHRCVTTVIHRH